MCLFNISFLFNRIKNKLGYETTEYWQNRAVQYFKMAPD